MKLISLLCVVAGFSAFAKAVRIDVRHHTLFKGNPASDAWLGLGNGFIAIGNALNRNWVFAGLCGFIAVVELIRWWRRRKRRNVTALAGAKSRALRDKLVRKAREAAKPRPVLHPQPGGAR